MQYSRRNGYDEDDDTQVEQVGQRVLAKQVPSSNKPVQEEPEERRHHCQEH